MAMLDPATDQSGGSGHQIKQDNPSALLTKLERTFMGATRESVDVLPTDAAIEAFYAVAPLYGTYSWTFHNPLGEVELGS